MVQRSLKPKKGDLRIFIPIIDYSVGLDSILNSTRFLFDDFLLLDEQQPPNDLTQSDVERCYFDALRLQLKYKNVKSSPNFWRERVENKMTAEWPGTAKLTQK